MKIAVQIAPILKRQRQASGLRAALWLRAWYRFWKSAEVLFMCLS